MCAFREQRPPTPRSARAGHDVGAPQLCIGNGYIEPALGQPAADEARDLGLPGAARYEAGVDRVDGHEISQQRAGVLHGITLPTGSRPRKGEHAQIRGRIGVEHDPVRRATGVTRL
jgi:hypothetical protein